MKTNAMLNYNGKSIKQGSKPLGLLDLLSWTNQMLVGQTFVANSKKLDITCATYNGQENIHFLIGNFFALLCTMLFNLFCRIFINNSCI